MQGRTGDARQPMTHVLFDWGLAGARALAADAAVSIVVDVLSFSTAVDVAVSRGAEVVPTALVDRDAIAAAARRLGATAAGRRGDTGASFTLSPASLPTIEAGTRLLLPSPNGSTISAALAGAMTGGTVFAGCLRNAVAVAEAALDAAAGRPILVIAAGEHWPDGSFRPAIEDLLGAGAILSHLGAADLTAEAVVARGAYKAARAQIADLIRDSISGRELVERGYPADVALAVSEHASTTAPVLQDGRFSAAR